MRPLPLRLALSVGVVALTATASLAQTVVEVFLEADAGAPVGLTFLETVTTDGTTAYAVLRDTTATDTGGIVSTTDGVAFSAVSTPADWATFGSTFDLALGNGVGVVGGVLRGVSFFDNNVIEVDLGTGAVTEVVSAAALDFASGVSSNFTAVFETTADGTIYATESVSDQIIAIAPDNTVSVEIDSVDFAAALGGTSIGGIGVSGDVIYLGSNSDDQLVAWNTVTDTSSVVLTEAQIESVTDDIDGNAGFGDIFAAPDGLIYFYESDSDYLLSFDPADPVGSLTAVVTETQFIDGPSSDTINQLSWFNGSIAFTDGGIGYYSVVPEPASATVLGLAVLASGLVRRRG